MLSERKQGRAEMTPRWSVAVTLAALCAACIPDKSCDFTRTCEPETQPDAAESRSTESSSSTVVDLDAAASGTETGETETSTAVDGGNPIVTCQRSTDCNGELRYCDDVALVCTECRDNTDCKSEEAPYCAVSLGAVQDNRCVECLAGSDTCSGACVDNRCATCDLETNAGCPEEAPHCTLVSEVPACVACLTSEDCASSPDTPVCDDFVCKACSAEAPESCPAQAPLCLEVGPEARCVECNAPEDCANLPDAGDAPALCIDERCTRCELGSNAGCPTDAPFCAALVPGDGDAGVQYVAPPPRSAEVPEEQYLDYEHRCVECVDDESGCLGGSLPGCFQGECVQCTKNSHCTSPSASVCDLESHTCVGCLAEGDCSHQENTQACDVATRTCVQCTAAEDTCGENACQTVPGEGQYTCSSAAKQRTAPCSRCVSDSACQLNSHCVQHVFDGEELGWYCFRKEAELTEADECADTRVFVDRFDGTSVDGVVGPFCRPRLTSCEGYLDYEEGPITGNNQQATCTSDDQCGADGLSDGHCVYFTASSNRCTYACLSSNDCKADVPCEPVTSVSGAVEDVCKVNP